MLHREGFRQFRVRNHGEIARIELAPDELPRLMESDRCVEISADLKASWVQIRDGGFGRIRPGWSQL